jgi:protein-S-isoprenylcysteine O-methyltransferase Ste14
LAAWHSSVQEERQIKHDRDVMATMTVDTSTTPMRWSWFVRSRAWISFLIIAPFVLACVFSRPPSFEGSWTEIGYDFIGWLLFMVGAGWRWWATLYIAGRKHWMIVTDGPYSVCRNPLYVGTFCMALGLVFFLESVTFAVGLLLMTAYYLPITVSAEERMLREKFGQPFIDYCERVPRFWPRFRLLQTPRKIISNVQGLGAEAVRTARWFWLPLFCEGIACLRAEPWWPKLFHLP